MLLMGVAAFHKFILFAYNLIIFVYSYPDLIY